MISKIFFYFGTLLSYLYPRRIGGTIKRCLGKINTGYKASSFASVGWPISIGKGTRIVGGKCFRLGNNVSFGISSVIEAYQVRGEQKFNPAVSIGNNCVFGDYTHITSINSITIGNNLLTGRRVLISDNSHGESIGSNNCNSLNKSPIERKLTSKGPVLIGDNVWIGDNVCILAGVTIGDGAIIGANTVVNKDIPSYSIAVGARIRIIERTIKNRL